MPWIFQLLIGIVASIAGSIISAISKQDQKQKVPGVRGTLQSGGDLSPRFIVGRYGTGGQLRYAGYWGNAGDVPNAYYSKVIEVSCLPIRGFSGFFVNGERVTLGGTKTGTLGYPVLEYRLGGIDHLWINPYLGNQTTEDPLMLAQFGAHPDRPYAGMIGRGCGMFVATALVNRELFTSLPEYLAEVDGIVLDDPRGDGQHDNPIAAIYTLLKGLTYEGEWVYGPQGMTNANFRAANLESEADKCDAPRVLAGGGTEKRYRIGLDIALEEEPHAVVGELLKACAGRWADLGGVYRFLVGGPSAAVVSFTDEDIVTSEQQTFEPFPGLENLFNAMNATYPEPAESWELKEAPPRYRSDLEVLDDNRRLPFSTQYKAVPWAVQVQELMRAAIEEVRRFRKHTHTMPPEWWEYEPLDVAAWTSSRNGYVWKDFLITAMDDLPNANQFVGLQEMDPSDYDWTTDYELPFDVAPLIIARPAPQQIIGFAVEPYIGKDNNGIARRPGFRIFGFGAGLVDVSEVWVQARLAETGALVIDGRAPYDPEEIEPSAQWTGDPILPAVQYEVRGKLVPFSGRATEWSAWLPVTTPDVKLTALDVIYGDIDLDELSEQVEGYFDWMGGNIRELWERAEEQDLHGADQELANALQFDEMRRSLTVVAADLSASFEETITVAIVPMQGQLVAVADALTELSAADEGNVNTARIRFTSMTGPAGYSRIGIETRFDPADSGDFRVAGSYWDTPNNPALPTRRMEIAQQFVIADSPASAAFQPFIFQDGTLRAANATVGQASIIDASITTSKIADASITSAKIGSAQITTAKIADGAITNAKIGTAAIGSAQIADAAITSAKIGDLQVGRLQLATGSVTDFPAASGSVSGATGAAVRYGPTFTPIGPFLWAAAVTVSSGGGTRNAEVFLETVPGGARYQLTASNIGVINTAGVAPAGLPYGTQMRMGVSGGASEGNIFNYTWNVAATIAVK